jgi:hypothetical protein
MLARNAPEDGGNDFPSTCKLCGVPTFTCPSSLRSTSAAWMFTMAGTSCDAIPGAVVNTSLPTARCVTCVAGMYAAMLVCTHACAAAALLASNGIDSLPTPTTSFMFVLANACIIPLSAL